MAPFLCHKHQFCVFIIVASSVVAHSYRRFLYHTGLNKQDLRVSKVHQRLGGYPKKCGVVPNSVQVPLGPLAFEGLGLGLGVRLELPRLEELHARHNSGDFAWLEPLSI